MRLLDYAAQYDRLTFSWLQQRPSHALWVPIARQISRSADGYFYSLLLLYCLVAREQTLLQLSVLCLASERALYFLLKKTTKRNRPPEAIPGFQSIITASDKFSFPSGHTSAAFLLAGLVYLHFPSWGWLLFPWASSVACSRVLLGVHFPSDTMAGATLGSSIALLGYHVVGA